MVEVRIDVISDVMCPWCFIGKKRLESAQSILEGIELNINWLPFQLDATLPKEGKDRQTYLSDKFGGKERAQIAYTQIEETGEAMGLPFAFDLILYSANTFDAHRIIHWAQEEQLQNEIVERLFQAYFYEGQHIGDDDVLGELCDEVGLDGDLMRDRLHTNLDRDTTQRQLDQVQKMGVSGVPCFILNQKYAIMGAQQPETLADSITRAATERD